MLSAADLPDHIPVFPLPGALVLPRSNLPLHIFEPRYVAMVDACLKTPHRLIGMVQPVSDDDDRLHTIGCAGRLTAFKEVADNRYLITLHGISRFRVRSLVESFHPFLSFEVDWAGFERDLGPEETDPGLNKEALFHALQRYFAAEGLQTDWGALKEADGELLINSLSMMCPFEPEEKQALLEAPSLQTRRETLMTLMEFAMRDPDGGTPIQ